MRTFKLIVAVIGLGALPARIDAAELTTADFEKLHGELVAAKEPWQSLPWQLSIVEARTLACKENKPIYMLCRSGHPLGCV